MNKIAYLKKCLAAQFDQARFSCPNCGSNDNETIARKFVITSLRRCGKCKLQFRVPTDNPLYNLDYYENEYSFGFTTDMPTDDELGLLVDSNFQGQKDWTYYNGVLRRLGLGEGARLFDFGCSWGYGSYQMNKAGYRVVGYEVAPTRRKYASEKLSVATVSDMEIAIADPEMRGTFDCFFSSHVLEHVPSPSRVFHFANSLLRSGGLFVSFTPNGSGAARSVSSQWSKWWGEVHPNFIDDKFLDHSFVDFPRVVGSSPIDNIDFPTQPEIRRLNYTGGPELFFAARKP